MYRFLLTQPTTDASNGGDLGSVIYIGFLILVLVGMYFLMIRPQKKQEKEIQQMRNDLQVGDEITTIGGIIGQVISIKEETVMIETGRDHTRIRILRSAVKSVDVKAEDAN